MGRFFLLLLCIALGALTLQVHIYRTNQLTRLQLKIPSLEREVRGLKKQEEGLQYQLDSFANPERLLLYLEDPRFFHLRFSHDEEVVMIERKEK